MSLPPLVSASRPAQSAAPLHGWPLLRLGFRPFYLGTALLACLAVPLWIAIFLGRIQVPLAMSPLLWHAHEMLFGFAAGVVVGFLLTAVKAWTGLETARGPLLGALALLWLAARLASLVAPYAVYATLDMLLLPAVAAVLLRVLIKAGNKRNIPLICLLLLMAAANLVFHLSVLGIVAVPAVSALYAELALILMVVSVITGRVVPMFTRNVTPGLVINMPRKFELSLLAVTAVALALWVFAAPAPVVLVASLAAGVMHAVRLWKWHPQVTFKRPILWILHASYAWLPLGFVLLALAQLGWVVPSLAVHAFAVGVIGGLIIGMVTRTARGHTGRPLQPSRGEVVAYALVMLAAVLRVLVPAVQPAWYAYALEGAACLWAIAFAIYLVIYTPWLMRTRLDGKDG
ncbi:short-chain dehydrogenase [Diaphorobacter nitroreducens]|uniref:NnrS family protein n=1 Tax=Diaphorobacter nitroreducens TaxID=164759 RepID=UPI000B59E43A|nr:NnrS family protein [Diaphorobacter nitroreducens]ASI67461.1 short-chain dehydrogenase [Diaphorobacter nitroreducens]